MELLQHSPFIWSIKNFISPEECIRLIEYSEQQGYQEAEISLESGPKMIKGIRNNSRLMLTDPLLAASYWDKLSEFCPGELDDSVAVGLNEQFRFYKYENDQRFKRHVDGRFKRNAREESRITFMIYLNEEFEGGETTFDDISIIPNTGDALLFYHEIKHEGCPVKSGIKYALRSDVMYRKYEY